MLPTHITVPGLFARKTSGPKIAAMTAYDYVFARILDEAGIDVILVGDSLGTVLQGHDNTLSVTLDEMVYHTRCVTRGVSRALVVADMPFMTYQISPEQALASAGRLLKEANAAAVKLEGGEHMEASISRLVKVDIPVMGHIGLTPQSYHRMGGHRQQGRRSDSDQPFLHAGTREQIIKDAKAVENAGAFCMVIEGVPADLAEEITRSVSIPTIGIGAGENCDGQILVSYDALGLTPNPPKFVKPYAGLAVTAGKAVADFIDEVRKTPALRRQIP